MHRVGLVPTTFTVAVVVVLGCATADRRAFADTGNGQVLGLTWHIGGVSGYDDVTGVDGGVIGSSLLMVKHPQPLSGAPFTEWIFLEGQYMWLSRPGGRPIPITATAGEFTISRKPHHFSRFAKAADKRMLTAKLLQFRRRFTDTSTWHVPFLTGKGWNPLNDASGATRQEAAAVLTKMGFTVNDGGESQNRRVATQSLEVGKNYSSAMPITLTFTGDPVPLIVPEGDTQATAILIACGTAVPVLRTVEMTFMHGDDAPDLPDGPDPDNLPDLLPGDADDVYFKLDAAAAGNVMRVCSPNGPRLGDDPIMLSAWKSSGGTLAPIQLLDPNTGAPLGGPNDNWEVGVDADITFEVPQIGDVFVVLDAAEYQVGPMTLQFQCRSRVEQFAGEQAD